MLRKMGLKLERIEDDIFEGRSSEIVRDISEVKQEIINFREIVRPQRAVLRDLERTKQRYLQEELEIYFDDISDAAERIWDTLENYKEVDRGARVDQRIGPVAPPERLVPDPDRGERRAPAADPDREHLRDERAASRARASRTRSSGSWLLMAAAARRDGRLLPAARLAVGSGRRASRDARAASQAGRSRSRARRS